MERLNESRVLASALRDTTNGDDVNLLTDMILEEIGKFINVTNGDVLMALCAVAAVTLEEIENIAQRRSYLLAMHRIMSTMIDMQVMEDQRKRKADPDQESET